MRASDSAGSLAGAALRVFLLLVLGLVLLARGMEYLNDRISDASRTPYPAAAAADAATRAAEAGETARTAPAPTSAAVQAPALPPPSDTVILALEASDAETRASALRQLRGSGTTPTLQVSLAAAAARAESPWERQFIACLRGRDPGTPLDDLLTALPGDQASDIDWRQEPAACLVEAIAARAAEDPSRTVPLLARRALADESVVIIDAFLHLDPSELPAALVAAADDPAGRQERLRAVRAAVALGAATTAPDRVAAWLDDPDRRVRLVAVRTLLARADDRSWAAAARAVAGNPGDESLQELVREMLRAGGGFEHHLSGLAADTSAANFARAQAAYLVSAGGTEAEARRVAALQSADPTLAPELAAAARAVAHRFGPAHGGAR